MSTKIEDGGPAFAALATSPMGDVHHQEGMSIRDWFAGQFLAGSATDNAALDVSVAADQFDIDAALSDHWANVARAAYIAADAMLAARAKADRQFGFHANHGKTLIAKAEGSSHD